jgi:hypothetical protein
MPTKFLRRYALTQVERHSIYVEAVAVSQEVAGSPGDLDIARTQDKAKNHYRGKGVGPPG